MTQELYIIRHGETDFNKLRIFQGRGVNSSLNDKGISQAEAFFKAYGHIEFDEIHTSSLKRTQETVSPFLQNGKTSFIPFAGLDEMNWGIYEGKKLTADENGYFKTLISDWKSGHTHRNTPEGENPDQIQRRVQDYLNTGIKGKAGKILISTHGRLMRILLCTLLNKKLSEMDEFPHKNLSLYKLVIADEKAEIAIFNDTNHLNG